MSDSNSPRSSSPATSGKLSLRRETVRALGVKTGVKTGEPPCTMHTMFSCNGSGPCTHSNGGTSVAV
jgi:hypothetical protein